MLGRAESMSGSSWLALLVETGQASISEDDGPIEGPALTWQRWDDEAQARFAPGATGCYLVLGSAALANAIGHRGDAGVLHELSDALVVKSLSRSDQTLATLQSAFRGVHRELASDAPGARAIVEAYLRIILIEVERAREPQSDSSPPALPATRIFTRFNTLVEQHFRDRWTVTDYAARLGLSRDRLGDICNRMRGQGPKAIIDRRLTREARAQLEGSSLSIQQIAALLGFASSPQFTRFFQRMTGVAPGRYRSQSIEAARKDSIARQTAGEWL